MWNSKVPETISEHPEEEDKESNKIDDHSDNMRKPNKVNKIIDLRKSQNSDNDQLFREKKINSMKNKLSPFLSREDRPDSFHIPTQDKVNPINKA
jgi:hypothetical protein